MADAILLTHSDLRGDWCSEVEQTDSSISFA